MPDGAAIELIGAPADGSGVLLVLDGALAELRDPHAQRVERVTPLLQGHTLMLLPVQAVAGGAAEHQALLERRRRECREAAHRMGAERLREAQLQDLHMLPDALARRAHHALAENGRALQAARALALGEMQLLARLLAASHASLRDLYDASSPAAEEAVRALERAGALGARLSGPAQAVVGLFGPPAPAPAGARAVLTGPPGRGQS